MVLLSNKVFKVILGTLYLSVCVFLFFLFFFVHTLHETQTPQLEKSTDALVKVILESKQFDNSTIAFIVRLTNEVLHDLCDVSAHSSTMYIFFEISHLHCVTLHSFLKCSSFLTSQFKCLRERK
jgi:hypothetical protein